MIKVLAVLVCLLGVGWTGRAPPIDNLEALCTRMQCPQSIWANPQATGQTPVQIKRHISGSHLMDLLQEYGPLLVKVMGDDIHFLKQISHGSIEDEYGCISDECSYLLVQLVGFTENHWIIYNYRYEESWGDNGYGYIAKNTGNNCRITSISYWANIGNEETDGQEEASIEPQFGRCIETNIGLVCIDNWEDSLPQGWRVVRQYEGESVKERLSLLLYEWDIVSLSIGALGGQGYNYEIRDSFPGEEIVNRFIVKIDPTTPYGECGPTPIGIVCIVLINSEIQATWRKVTLDQGKTMKEDLNKLLTYWSIVAFETGKLDGFGYGNAFSDTHGAEVGEVFITRAYNTM